MAHFDRNNFRIQRRSLLRTALGGMVGLAAAPVMAATGYRKAAEHQSLSFRHLHTGENLTVSYLENGRYIADALAEIDEVLRDFRTGEKISMDINLLEILYRLRTRLGSDQPFEIISAYRSPKTNAALAAKNPGVAKRSYHTNGMAIDVRLPGRRLLDLRQSALDLRLGGVGYYRRSNFVHLDTGRVRYW